MKIFVFYFYFISVIPPLGDVIDVFGHVKVIERVNVNTHCKLGQYKLIMFYCTNFISFFSCRLHFSFLYRFGLSIFGILSNMSNMDCGNKNKTSRQNDVRSHFQ